MNTKQANPLILTPTVCEKCMALHSLKDFLVERLVMLEGSVVQGLLVCPDCGDEKHCYYMDAETRAKKSIVMQRMNIAKSNGSKVRDTFAQIQLLQRQYQFVHNECQEKYKQLLGEVST